MKPNCLCVKCTTSSVVKTISARKQCQTGYHIRYGGTLNPALFNKQKSVKWNADYMVLWRWIIVDIESVWIWACSRHMHTIHFHSHRQTLCLVSMLIVSWKNKPSPILLFLSVLFLHLSVAPWQIFHFNILVLSIRFSQGLAQIGHSKRMGMNRSKSIWNFIVETSTGTFSISCANCERVHEEMPKQMWR